MRADARQMWRLARDSSPLCTLPFAAGDPPPGLPPRCIGFAQASFPVGALLSRTGRGYGALPALNLGLPKFRSIMRKSGKPDFRGGLRRSW